MRMYIKRPRRDGKFPVRISYRGGANAFGGFYPTKVFNKLYTDHKVQEVISAALPGDDIINDSGIPFTMPYFEEETDEPIDE